MEVISEQMQLGGETLPFTLDPNVIFLVSADRPGCGSSTLARMIGERLCGSVNDQVEVQSIGDEIKKRVGAKNEEELHEKLSEINDPHHFDPLIYGALNDESAYVVDGKLATVAGPMYLKPGRQIVTIDLSSDNLVSAKRILQRQDQDLMALFGKAPTQTLINHLNLVQARSRHDDSLHDQLMVGDTGEHAEVSAAFTFNSSEKAVQEIVADIFGDGDFSDHVPEWELSALEETLRTLTAIGVSLRKETHALDKSHYDHSIESIAYNIDRLNTTIHPVGLASIRDELRKSIIDCSFGLMMKKIPRFYMAGKGQGEATDGVIFDNESHYWSPEFYKVAEGWPILSKLLEGKVVLDPFAGAGTLINLLVARGIPRSVVCSDIAYPGGQTVNNSTSWYHPHLNVEAARLLFDDLPSWYKPDMKKISGHVTSDARKLPMADSSVDYVFADPPYGKNLQSEAGGIGLLFGVLPELRRVSKEGAILMVPCGWLDELRGADIPFEQLTKDVSSGNSGYPVCYILIK